MTKKIYRSAMGKVVDMGALQLQNENVRAVGNMSVNARGDSLDSFNRVIDKKTQQIQRQTRRQSNVGTAPVRAQPQVPVQEPLDTFDDLPEDNDVVIEKTSAPTIPEGGLASAIARSRSVQQQLEKTPRELAKQTGIKKI